MANKNQKSIYIIIDRDYIWLKSKIIKLEL